MNWNDTDKVETVEGYLDHFKAEIENNPKVTMDKMALELESLYVRFDNDQEGRGVVGDSSIMGNIAALEAVRAECIKLLKERGEWPPKLAR